MGEPAIRTSRVSQSKPRAQSWLTAKLALQAERWPTPFRMRSRPMSCPESSKNRRVSRTGSRGVGVVTTGEFPADVSCDAGRIAAHGGDGNHAVASGTQERFQRRVRLLAFTVLNERQRGAGDSGERCEFGLAEPAVT